MKEAHEPIVITIDGPSGSGKGTVSRLVAKALGYKFLDSGALYRVLALAAIKHQVAFDHEEAITLLAEHLDVQFDSDASLVPRIILEGEDVAEAIRHETISDGASKVAVIGSVREALLSRQRAFRESPGLVADGRDMGTVVFKDAPFKFFLTASLKERAKRRYQQLKDSGYGGNLDDLMSELKKRDERDSGRLVAPTKPAEDAICIDTDTLTAEAVADRIISEIKQKKAFPVTATIHIHRESAVTV